MASDHAVSGAGDVNGDGYADVIVGARLYDHDQNNEGQAYVYFSDGVPPSIQVTKYYMFGAKRVAMRQNGTLTYLHADHLGSTSLATDEGGGVIARQLYYPYGETRYITGPLPTDFGFTGQRSDGYIKLTDMGARWYDPVIGRWISPDSIVPQPGNPQALNRFSYCVNNPLKYVDPSGHAYDRNGEYGGSEEDLDPYIAGDARHARYVILDQGDTMMDWHKYVKTNQEYPFETYGDHYTPDAFGVRFDVSGGFLAEADLNYEIVWPHGSLIFRAVQQI